MCFFVLGTLSLKGQAEQNGPMSHQPVPRPRMRRRSVSLDEELMARAMDAQYSQKDDALSYEEPAAVQLAVPAFGGHRRTVAIGDPSALQDMVDRKVSIMNRKSHMERSNSFSERVRRMASESGTSAHESDESDHAFSPPRY